MATLLLLVALGSQAAGSVSRISGLVTDATSLPLPGAIVELDGRVVAISDESGAFEIVVTPGAGSRLRVALDGFESYESGLPPGSRHIEVTLVVRGIEDRVRVTARPPRPPVQPVFTRQPIDVYRTPGAQGDLFRALQTLPGVAAPDDAAGLFVRGGDVSEVLVSLDDAVMAHPYRYETPTGGFRGAVDPLLITGIAFSTGGFGARHGNALSAVMDLRGLDRPALPEISGTVGLAGAAAAIGVPVRDRVGVRAAVNRTFTELLFAVNGSPRRFEPAPEGWDGSAGLSVDFASGGSVKVFAMAQRDSVGVEAERDAYAGWLTAGSQHSFMSARWDGAIGQWRAAATLGNDRYTRRTAVGVLDLGCARGLASWCERRVHAGDDRGPRAAGGR
jgi:hypothetical protein